MGKIKRLSKRELNSFLSELERPELEAEAELVGLGENRGQFFVRIPKHFSQQLNLKKANKMKMIVKDGKLVMEVV
ncbi:MAG: AbrB/MazE/SpoVT family DNA-binding domain-containing protein [Candidatus Aenigmarchaeota archaeon]|nr:AbrB/MazE/SpoVT family DNA-binding domain-containing protein [Candidatus Aenigmarchaeota archaeon]MBI5224678.1 AbrB/MazE/SpoVT family DNA-binding domain-containing protein [Candidatus Micrarchaeota archaeon]